MMAVAPDTTIKIYLQLGVGNIPWLFTTQTDSPCWPQKMSISRWGPQVTGAADVLRAATLSLTKIGVNTDHP